MPKTKSQIIREIYRAFENVTLEDGVGLWEGLAQDNYLQGKEYENLKVKDERLDWQKIPIVDIYKCSSSISFHDAKGMRFHLGLYLLFALDVFLEEEDALYANKNFKLSPPEIQFALVYNLESNYSRKRFSLLNKVQIQCIIHFLELDLNVIDTYEERVVNKTSNFIKKHAELKAAIAFWKAKALATKTEN